MSIAQDRQAAKREAEEMERRAEMFEEIAENLQTGNAMVWSRGKHEPNTLFRSFPANSRYDWAKVRVATCAGESIILVTRAHRTTSEGITVPSRTWRTTDLEYAAKIAWWLGAPPKP